MSNLTYLGHSAFLLKSSNFTALFDPFQVTGKLGQKEMEEIDAIFVTHGHGDHFGDTLEIARISKATVYTNMELANWLAKNGVPSVGLQFGVANFDFGQVRVTSAKHSNSFCLEPTYPCGEACGFILTLDGKKIYHAGDTALTADMQLLQGENLDVACLPIGGYYTMDARDAVRATTLIAPKIVVPMHFNTFAQIKQNPAEFAKMVQNSNLQTEVKVLEIGESLCF